MKKNTISEKLQDRSSIHMIFVLIASSFSFAITLHLGKAIWYLVSKYEDYFSKLGGENIEIYQQFIMSALQITLSGFIIFTTPIFFCTLLSLMPRQKMLISPWYVQITVFSLLVIYFATLLLPNVTLFVQILFIAIVVMTLSGFAQHTLVEKLVGIKLNNLVKYSLKTRNASIEQITESLMVPEVRNELKLSKNAIQIYTGIRIIGKKLTRSTILELRESTEKDETFINVLFYRTANNSITSSNMAIYSWKQFQYLKKILSDSHISFQEADAEKNTQFLVEFIEHKYAGMYKIILEYLKASIFKIILFAVSMGIIVYLFWDGQLENAIFAVLTVLLSIVFAVTLYARKNKTSESPIF